MLQLSRVGAAPESVTRTASKNDCVRQLVDLVCKSISFEGDESLKLDLESLVADTKDMMDAKLIDVIVEFSSYQRKGHLLDRYSDRKNPAIFLYNVLHGTRGESESERRLATETVDQILKPLVGETRADAIFKMSNWAAWREQNQLDWDGSQGGYLTGHAKGYKEDAETCELWRDYWASQMGFDDGSTPGITPNIAAKKLCFAKCRSWTVEQNADGGLYFRKPRTAALEIARLQATEAGLSQEFCEGAERMAASYRTLTYHDRKDRESARTAQARRDVETELESLRTLLGDRATALFEVCKWAAWSEQNHLDHSMCGVLQESAAAGYRADAEQDRQKMDLAAYQLGLDDSVSADATTQNGVNATTTRNTDAGTGGGR